MPKHFFLFCLSGHALRNLLVFSFTFGQDFEIYLFFAIVNSNQQETKELKSKRAASPSKQAPVRS